MVDYDKEYLNKVLQTITSIDWREHRNPNSYEYKIIIENGINLVDMVEAIVQNPDVFSLFGVKILGIQPEVDGVADRYCIKIQDKEIIMWLAGNRSKIIGIRND